MSLRKLQNVVGSIKEFAYYRDSQMFWLIRSENLFHANKDRLLESDLVESNKFFG